MFARRNSYQTVLLGAFVAIVAVACSSTPAAAPTAAAPAQAPGATAASEARPAPGDGAGALHTWEIEDVGEGAKPALALTSDGVPHVAYMLESMTGYVRHAVRNGSSWDITTISEGYFYGPLDIAIGPGDVPHISYHDHQDLRGFQPDKGDAAYAVLRDGSWTVEEVFDPGHDGWDNRIVIDSEGRPHISAIDPKEFEGDGVEYYHRDASGKWTVESLGTGPQTYKYATSIAVDPDGNPHITYHDQDDKDLALASRDGSGWNISVVDGEGDTGLFSYLLIDANGRFHISYFLKESKSSGTVKYATKGPADSTWEMRDVDTLDMLSFGFLGARNITSLALDGQGNPWIAYTDERVVKLALWDGSGWQVETVVDAGAQELGQIVSLKLDSEDQPHITYFELTSKRPVNGRVKYAKGTAS